jgi:hypothetical protein
MSDLPPPPPVPGPGPYGRDDVSIGDAFSYGWKKFTQYLGPIILITLAVFIGIAIFQALSFLFQRSGDFTFGRFFLSLVFGGLAAIVGFILQYGVVRAALAIVEGRTPTFSEAWNMERFGPFVVAAILQGLITFVGYLLCIIPGLIAAFFLFFTPFFVIDKRMAPVESLTASYNLVKDNAGKLLVFCIVAVLVYFAGALVCLVGLLVSIPVVLIATAYMFKRTQGEPVAA